MPSKQRSMKISSRFKLFFGAFFLLLSIVFIILVNVYMHRNALYEAERKAREMLDAKLAIHTYFSQQLKPDLFDYTSAIRSEDDFNPKWMSSTYAIREIIKYTKSFGEEDYYYKECAVNARSPENEADPYEASFLKDLKNNPELVSQSSILSIDGGKYFVVLRRGEAMEKSCLQCHGDPNDAPRGLIDIYGAERSFNRKKDDVVQAISIRIPLNSAYSAANWFSVQLSGVLLTLLLLLFLTQHFISNRWIFNPLNRIYEKARLIATDRDHLGEEIDPPRGRELEDLACAFNSMSKNLRYHIDNLDAIVKERTLHLIETNNRLEIEINERKRIEKELIKSYDRYRGIVENSRNGIAVYEVLGEGKDFVFVEFNQAGEKIDNINRQQVLGNCLTEIFPGAKDFGLLDILQRVWKTGESERLPQGFYDDDRISGWRDNFVYKLPSGEVVVLYSDETERVRMEEEFLRSKKLESVGILAGGIAHDFNNILTTILGNVSMAKTQVETENEIYDLLNEAEAASIRAQMLTKQLLTFAKGGMPVKEIASIKDILEESCRFVLRGSKSGCEFSIEKDLWPAEVDVGQMSQVINNIVINANQAMPKGGTIQVAAKNLITEDGHGLPFKPGKYIWISIIDQGLGIAEEHLSNIFDPYFTTKQEGSGLGLATTYSIIKKHGGHITMESRLGVGTTFHIYLPASDKAVPEKEDAQLIKGQGRILVMDDEASLRKTIGRMLEKLGYEPEFAVGGNEAIGMYKAALAAGKPYAAVILDLTIPGGMGGKDAINKLLEIAPDIKAIVFSGYSNDPVLANFREYGFKGMLPKPFDPAVLSKVLHEALKD